MPERLITHERVCKLRKKVSPLRQMEIKKIDSPLAVERHLRSVQPTVDIASSPLIPQKNEYIGDRPMRKQDPRPRYMKLEEERSAEKKKPLTN